MEDGKRAEAKHLRSAMFVGKPSVDCGPCGNQMFPTFVGRLACRVYMGGLWAVKLERSRAVVGSVEGQEYQAKGAWTSP